MSIQLQKTYSVANVLTDVTSWTVSVARNDTNAVISSGNMTHAGTGVYTYAFDEPQLGLTYAVSYVVTPSGGNPISFSDIVTGNSSTTFNGPTLTGDPLIDSYNTLLSLRLYVLSQGPSPDYVVHGHALKMVDYMKYLDQSIMQLLKEIGQRDCFEQVSLGGW